MKLTRTLALVMAILMMVSSAALAEAKLYTVTIDNISIQQNADKATALGLAMKFAGGGDENKAYVNLAASGNNNSIANAEFAMEDGNVTLALDGLTNNYAISKADMQKLMDQAVSQAETTDMPFDQKDLQDLMTSYITALQQAKEMGKTKLSPEESKQFYEDAGFVVGAEEAVTVNGVEMTLPRYDVDLDAQGMDKLISASLNRLPAMKEFMAQYVAFVEKVAAKAGDTVTIDPDHMFSGIYSQMGAELRIKATVWTDEQGENMRMEMEETITEPAAATESAEGEAAAPAPAPKSVTVPMTMQVNTDERGQHATMNMDMNQDDVQITMNIKLNDAMLEEGAKGNFSFVVDAMGETVDMTGDYSYDAAGKGAVNFEMNVPMGDSALSRNTLKVTSTGGDVNKHSVQLRTMQLQKSGALTKEQSRFTISFDVTTEAGALPEAALISNGKPSVDIPTMTEEQQDQAMEELMTKGIMAYGQLMATDGVAKLMSDMVMVAKDAFEAVTTEASTAA